MCPTLKSGHATIEGIVNFRSFLDLKTALNLKVLAIEKAVAPINGVTRDVYKVGPIVIRRCWEWAGF